MTLHGHDFVLEGTSVLEITLILGSILHFSTAVPGWFPSLFYFCFNLFSCSFFTHCRQRMVYKAIWLELQDTVHAVDAMTTKTPAEAAA